LLESLEDFLRCLRLRGWALRQRRRHRLERAATRCSSLGSRCLPWQSIICAGGGC